MLNNHSNKLNQYTKYTRDRVHNDILYDQFRDGTSISLLVKFLFVHPSEPTQFDDVI